MNKKKYHQRIVNESERWQRWRTYHKYTRKRNKSKDDLTSGGSSATGTDQAAEKAGTILSQEEVDALLDRGSSATGENQAVKGTDQAVQGEKSIKDFYKQKDFDEAAADLGRRFREKVDKLTKKAAPIKENIEMYKNNLEKYNFSDEQFEAFSKRIDEYNNLKKSKKWQRYDNSSRVDAGRKFSKDMREIAGEIKIDTSTINTLKDMRDQQRKLNAIQNRIKRTQEHAEAAFEVEGTGKTTEKQLLKDTFGKGNRAKGNKSWGKGKWAAAAGVVGAALGALAVGVGVSHMMMSGGQQSNTNLYNPGYASY